jgi:hypothetical protein
MEWNLIISRLANSKKCYHLYTAVSVQTGQIL